MAMENQVRSNRGSQEDYTHRRFVILEQMLHKVIPY